MVLTESFEDFRKKISLDDTRKERIITAHNAVREWLECQEEICELSPYTFLQGSYASFTPVKPQNEGSFDVDVVVVMDLLSFKENGRDVIEFLAEVLSKHQTYKDKIVKMNHCVRLQYAGDFHLDITPAHRVTGDDDPLEIPNDWHISHPKGLIDYCRERNKNSGEYFYQVVKLFKWWRNLRYGDEGSPKSIILLTLVGMFIPSDSDSLDEAFINTLKALCAFFDDNDEVPELTNPSLDEETYGKEVISTSWSESDYSDFKTKLKDALTDAKAALKSKEEQDSIDLWNSDNLFMGTFPKKFRGLAEEAKRYFEAAEAKTIKVASTGVLSIGGVGRSVPHTREYGDTKTEE